MTARKREEDESYENYRDHLVLASLVEKLRRKGKFRAKFWDCHVELIKDEDGKVIGKTNGVTYRKED